VVVVITKIDACPRQVLRNMKQLTHDKLRSPGVGKRPDGVGSKRDIETVKNKMHTLVPASGASCVTGEGLDQIRKLLVVLPKRRQHHKKIERPFEFTVEDHFNVADIGIIVSGFVNAQEWRKGDALHIGPLKDGTHVKTAVETVHVDRIEVDRVWAGRDTCFALSLTKSQRKKMLSTCKGVVALQIPVSPSKSFTAEIFLMKGDPVTMINGRYRRWCYSSSEVDSSAHQY
jgi:GTPase